MPERKLRAVEGGRATPRSGKKEPAPAKQQATPKKRGRPVSRLTSALREGSTERDMLVVLRAKLAAQIDNGPAHTFDRCVRQFMQVDAKVRAIDAREAEGDDSEDEDEDGLDEGAWDPSQL